MSTDLAPIGPAIARLRESSTLTPTLSLKGRGSILVQMEAEELGGVGRGDLAPVLLGRALEDALQELARLRPRRLGVGEVAAPQHIVDADDVPELDAEVVLHELHEHVAVPV